MMCRKSVHHSITTHIMIALTTSLVVNFSYMLLLMVSQPDDGKHAPRMEERGERRGRERSEQPDAEPIVVSGCLRMGVDGFGYLTPTDNPDIDSVYVRPRFTRGENFADGDTLTVKAVPSWYNEGGHYRMIDIVSINGQEFDLGKYFDRPSRVSDMFYQLLYYFAVSLLVLLIMTAGMRVKVNSVSCFAKRAAAALAVVGVLYFLAPVTRWHANSITMIFQSKPLFDFLVVLKCAFMYAVLVLYSRIYLLMSQRQDMLLENERLRSENLQTRYNVLVSQVNPHFFFNSLNSLSMLVRESDRDRALKYIEQLSYTFRYIIQCGQSTVVTLREEMDFAQAYIYLFKMRYADKIVFDIEIDDQYMSWTLPALSLQPLLDNATKHNAISAKCPLHVRIYTDNGSLVVENPKVPMLEKRDGTGIGLQNLNSRWELLTGEQITIHQNEQLFAVRMPMHRPQ